MLKSKLTDEFQEDLKKFIDIETKKSFKSNNLCIKAINDSLDENRCKVCESDLVNTVILKCGHIFCMDCSVNMLGDNCSTCKYDLKYYDSLKIPNNCISELRVSDITNSTKLEKIINLVTEINNKQEKVLIFTQFVGFMKIISNKLDENNFKNVWIDGTCSQE